MNTGVSGRRAELAVREVWTVRCRHAGVRVALLSMWLGGVALVRRKPSHAACAATPSRDEVARYRAAQIAAADAAKRASGREAQPSRLPSQNMPLSFAASSGMTWSTSQCSTTLPPLSNRKMSMPA